MAKYKALNVADLLKVIEVHNEKTGESELLSDVLEKRYQEILGHVNTTGLSGELTMKLKILAPSKSGRVVISADVANKLKRVKNEIFCEQANDGKVYLDNPDQIPIEGVAVKGVE